MRIAAVSTCKNEADIIGATLAHLYNEGVANVYIADGMSTDGTRDILSGFPCKMYDDTEDYHRQPYWISRLAQQAYEDGADWVIPFDADEFWVAAGFFTLAEAFELIEPEVGIVTAGMFQYVDFNYREPDVKPWPKVAFRSSPDVSVANGNHSVTGVPGATVGGVLEICEVQYRGFEHFCRKIVERNATIDPSLPYSEGTHHKQYAGWTKEQLQPVWEAMVARATVLDPIPVRR